MKFSNHLFDNLANEKNYLKTLRQYCGLTRDQLAELLDISPHTIRRYETTNQAPRLYVIALRSAICGDLSCFGQAWSNCQILNGELLTPYTPYARLKPADLNARYSRITQHAYTLNADLKNQVTALKAMNKDLLSATFGHKKTANGGGGSKVIPLFG
jgi:DNA-binding XRE family transcriptional regulator